MPFRRNPQRSSSYIPLLLIAVGVVLILAVIVWQAFSNPAPADSSIASTSNLPSPNVVRTSLKDAKAAYDQKSAIFVDVRDADSYKVSHVTGAINIPLADIDSRAKELSTSQWIILYCT
jgi:hypothetical protein